MQMNPARNGGVFYCHYEGRVSTNSESFKIDSMNERGIC